jgi:SAM-dependent methyltransferase
MGDADRSAGSSREAPSPSDDGRLGRVVRAYRLFARFYDAFRRVWSAWTRVTETRLDELFAERIGPTARVLELGPGTGVNLARIERLGLTFGSYLGIDASDEMLARARERFGSSPKIELRRGDVRKLADVPGGFDFVVSTWVLSHLERPADVVREAVALLAPGGSAVFLVSGRPTARWLAVVLTPFYRWAGARFVEPRDLEPIPGLEALERRSLGLASLAVFRAGASGPPS